MIYNVRTREGRDVGLVPGADFSIDNIDKVDSFLTGSGNGVLNCKYKDKSKKTEIWVEDTFAEMIKKESWVIDHKGYVDLLVESNYKLSGLNTSSFLVQNTSNGLAILMEKDIILLVLLPVSETSEVTMNFTSTIKWFSLMGRLFLKAIVICLLSPRVYLEVMK